MFTVTYIPDPSKPIFNHIKDITDVPGQIKLEWEAGDGIQDRFKVHHLNISIKTCYKQVFSHIVYYICQSDRLCSPGYG